jgi:hypothetical protein
VAWIVSGILALLLAASIFALWHIVTSPALRYHSFWYRAKAWLVFNFGHVRRIGHAPWFKLYGYDERLMTMRDVRNASAAARPGDVGLHLDGGFASNLAIPGAFKHAWIFVDGHDCVEAVAEGVVRRDDMTPLATDYAVVLRAAGVGQDAVDLAVSRAKAIVGCEYDANFRFDFEEEEAELSGSALSRQRAARYEASRYVENMRGGFHRAFSCTEAVAFSWYRSKDKLRIFRTIYAGREAVIADDFLKMEFDIVWASPNVTVEWAKQAGLHEEGRQKIADFLAGRS